MDSCIDSFSCTDSKLVAATKQGIKVEILTQLWDTCEDSGLLASTMTHEWHMFVKGWIWTAFNGPASALILFHGLIRLIRFSKTIEIQHPLLHMYVRRARSMEYPTPNKNKISRLCGQGGTENREPEPEIITHEQNYSQPKPYSWFLAPLHPIPVSNTKSLIGRGMAYGGWQNNHMGLIPTWHWHYLIICVTPGSSAWSAV